MVSPVSGRGFRLGAGFAVPSTTEPQPAANAATTSNAVADPTVRMAPLYLAQLKLLISRQGHRGERDDHPPDPDERTLPPTLTFAAHEFSQLNAWTLSIIA